MAKLIVPFTPNGPVPAGGYRLSYKPKGSPAAHSVHPANFFASPIEVDGVVAQDYEGFIEGDRGDGTFCPKVPFSTNAFACPGIKDFTLSATTDSITVSAIQLALVPTGDQSLTARIKDLSTGADVGAAIAIVVDKTGAIKSPAEVKFSGLLSGRNHEVRISNDCNPAALKTKTQQTTAVEAKQWVEDTYVCETDAVFNLVAELAGFSSPSALLYHAPSGRVYVADADNVNGNAYYFNPNTVAGPNDVVYVPGISIPHCYMSKADKQYNRLYFCGRNSGGLKVLDLGTHAVTTIPYGTDNVDYNRVVLSVSGPNIYVMDIKTNPEMVVIDRATLSVVSRTFKSSIPSGNTYLRDFQLFRIGGKNWIVSAYNSSPDVAIYNDNFTVLEKTIALPGAATEVNGSNYRQSGYFDSSTNRLYVGDAGSRKLFVIDCGAQTVEHTETYDNTDRANAIHFYVDDPVTGELYKGVSLYDNPAQVSLYNMYLVERTYPYAVRKMFAGQGFNTLVHQEGTAVIWGCQGNAAAWVGGSWNTDGKILKYSR